jgi:hypothetical protein
MYLVSNEIDLVIDQSIKLAFLCNPSPDKNTVTLNPKSLSQARKCDMSVINENSMIKIDISVFVLEPKAYSELINEINKKIEKGTYSILGTYVHYKRLINFANLSTQNLTKTLVSELKDTSTTFQRYLPVLEDFPDCPSDPNYKMRMAQKIFESRYKPKRYIQTYDTDNDFQNDLNIILTLIDYEELSQYILNPSIDIDLENKTISYPLPPQSIPFEFYAQQNLEICERELENIYNAAKGYIDISKAVKILKYKLSNKPKVFFIVPDCKLSDFLYLNSRSEPLKQYNFYQLLTKGFKLPRLDLFIGGENFYANKSTHLIKVPEDQIEDYVKYYDKYKSICHENFIQMYGINYYKDELYIFTEFYEKNSFSIFFKNLDFEDKEFRVFNESLNKILDLIEYLSDFIDLPLFLSMELLDYSTGKVKLIPNFNAPVPVNILSPEELCLKLLTEFKDQIIQYMRNTRSYRSLKLYQKENKSEPDFKTYFNAIEKYSNKISISAVHLDYNKELLEFLKNELVESLDIVYELFTRKKIESVDTENKDLLNRELYTEKNIVLTSELYRFGLLIYNSLFYSKNHASMLIEKFQLNSSNLKAHAIQTIFYRTMLPLSEDIQRNYGVYTELMRGLWYFNPFQRLSIQDLKSFLK